MPTDRVGGATVGEAMVRLTAKLVAAGIESPRREARLMLDHVLGKDVPWAAYPERSLTETQNRDLAALAARRADREPWSRIVGVREFWSLPFQLSPDTLDPRADSETLVEAVLGALPDRRASSRLLDLGTGTGCLLLALLSELPNARGVGVDLSPGAARTAARNAHALGLADRARFMVGDWGTALAGPFDAIVVNPPYIAADDIAGLEPEVAAWDPRLALAGGFDGLDPFRTMASQLRNLVSLQGIIAVELGVGQDGPATRIATAAGLDVVARPHDLFGRVRALLMRRR